MRQNPREANATRPSALCFDRHVMPGDKEDDERAGGISAASAPEDRLDTTTDGDGLFTPLGAPVPHQDPYRTLARLLLTLEQISECDPQLKEFLQMVLSHGLVRQLIGETVQVKHGRCILTDEERYGALGSITRR